MDFVRWVDEKSASCEACKGIYSKKDPPENPPCHECKTELSPENREVIDVYFMTRGQVISAGMGGVVDIDIRALKTVMDLMGIKDQKGCLIKVRRLFHEFRPGEKENE